LQVATEIEKGSSGLVFYIQIFASAAHLNIQIHVITLDGLYERNSTRRLKLYVAQLPTIALE
jgi:hypothetical protein